MILFKILYGLFFMSLGFVIIKYRRIVKWWTGNMYFIEQYLWRGSTYLIIILVWIGLILFWFFYPFGWLPFMRDWTGEIDVL